MEASFNTPFVNIIWNKTIVYTGGTFDLFHSGHTELLEYCRMFAGENGKVVVGLNTDEFINDYKGNMPWMNYQVRRDVLEACRYVDEVIPNESGADSKPTILKARADIVVIGMDWLEKDYCAQMQFTPQWLNDNKISLVYAPRTRGVSSSGIKQSLTQR